MGRCAGLFHGWSRMNAAVPFNRFEVGRNGRTASESSAGCNAQTLALEMGDCCRSVSQSARTVQVPLIRWNLLGGYTVFQVKSSCGFFQRQKPRRKERRKAGIQAHKQCGGASKNHRLLKNLYILATTLMSHQVRDRERPANVRGRQNCG